MIFFLFPLTGYSTTEVLNERIKTFNYGPDTCENRPPPISEKRLKETKKVNMNATEMFNFTHNVTFLIGDLIPEEDENGCTDPTYEFVKNIVKLLDLSFLPWYEPLDLENLKSAVKLVLEQYQEIGEELKPVFHFLTHYATNTKRYGPSRYLKTLR